MSHQCDIYITDSEYDGWEDDEMDHHTDTAELLLNVLCVSGARAMVLKERSTYEVQSFFKEFGFCRRAI